MPRQKSTHVDDPVAVGERLRLARERAGISQRALAFEGCSPGYISRIEAGERIPSLQLLRELGARLGVDADYLACGVEPEAPRHPLLVDAEIALRLGDLEQARDLYAVALDQATEAADLADALTGLGNVALSEGSTETAVRHFERALDRAGGDPAAAPAIAESLGRAYAQSGELPAAIATFRRCVEHYRGEGDKVALVRFACLLGYALTDNGDFAEAERVVAEALEAGRDTADPYTRARLYWSQSRLLGEQGKAEASARYAQRALDTLRLTEDTYWIAHAHQLLATVYLDAGRADDAATLLAEGRPLIEATAMPGDLAHYEIEEARALAALGRHDDAASLAMRATNRLREARPVDAGRGYVLLGQILEEIGQPERALEIYELAVEMLEQQPATRYLLDAHKHVASLLERLGDTDGALASLKRALGVQERAGRLA